MIKRDAVLHAPERNNTGQTVAESVHASMELPAPMVELVMARAPAPKVTGG